MNKKPNILKIIITTLILSCPITHAFPENFTYRIPDTGQTKCYDNEKEIPCPKPGEPFYGQDGNYSINPMSYTKLDENGNDLPDSAKEWAMVRDNVSGLIWEVKTDNFWDKSIHDKDRNYFFIDAIKVFKYSLNHEKFGGFSDWRLPNKRELCDIVDYGRYNPSINSRYFPNTKSSYFWSINLYALRPTAAYHMIVLFESGSTDCTVDGHKHYVRAVRGEQSQSLDDLINENGSTLIDSMSGLIWQQGESEKMTWKVALKYCETLSLIGYEDWRLPTLKELNSISPALGKKGLTDAMSSYYWSSTTDVNSTDYAWCIEFGSIGSVRSIVKTDSNYVRAVRNIYTNKSIFKVSPSPPKAWFTSPQNKHQTLLPHTEVTVRAENLIDSPDALSFYVNHKPLPPEKRPVRPTLPGTKTIEVTRQVSLDIGFNWIEVIALGENNKAISESLLIIRQDIPKPTLYFFGAGVSKHVNPTYSLRYPAKDVTGLGDVLKNQKGKAYSDVKIKTLTDNQATRTEVITQLSNFIDMAEPDDVVILFLSGHGKNEKGDYYFVTHDTDPDKLIATGLSWFKLISILSNVKSKVLFLVDTCYSGNVIGNDLIQKTGRRNFIIFTSSSGDRVSREDAAWGHGAFTKALIEGFQGKAFNRDKELNLLELYNFVKQYVRDLTDGSQEPKIPDWENFDKFENVILAREK